MTIPAKPRIAIVGPGFISEYHVNGLRAAGGAEIACLVGRDPVRTGARAAALGISRFETDLAAVLSDSGIDAAVIATPDALHKKHAVAALEQGKAVLLQKPMALDAAQCADIIAAAQRTTAPLTVSFMHRYFPEVRWLNSMLDDGRLGRVHTVRIRNATPGADWADWFFSPANVSGGVVMQLGVHGIDLCGHLFGPIAEVGARLVTARPRRKLADGREVAVTMEDNVVAQYTLASGALVSHEMSYTEIAGCDRFRLELYADHGTVWLRTERGRASIFAPEITGTDGWVSPDLPDEEDGAAHHRHWLDIVRRTVEADDTAIAGLTSIVVAEAVYRAAREGRRVAVEMPQIAKGAGR